MRATILLGMLSILTPLVVSCTVEQDTTAVHDDVSDVDGGGAKVKPQKQPAQYFSQSLDKDIDLLFVIDNSGSMAEEQANLAKNFPALIEALRNPSLGPDGSGKPCNQESRDGCTIPNLHIGVVSTDLGAGPYTSLPSCEAVGGDGGRLQNKARVAGCTPPDKRYISFIDGKVNVPNAGDPIEAVKEAFSCIARLGTGGCGFEQQLEAAHRALNPDNRINDGFLRKDALLAIVFITDEDDCSAKNLQLFDPTQDALTDPLGPITSFRCFDKGIQCDINDRNRIGPRKNCVPAYDWLYDIERRYKQFFIGLKPPGRVIISAIAGPTNRVEVGKAAGKPELKQSCQSAQGIAVPGIRIEALTKSMARGNGQFTSICEADFGPLLQALGKMILGKLDAQCLASPLLTPKGSMACQKGTKYAPGVQCRESCLHEVSCDVKIGNQETNRAESAVQKCPVSMWYPGDWRTDRDCKDKCPCWRIVEKEKQDCDPAFDRTPYALDILYQVAPKSGAFATVHCTTSSKGWGTGELGELRQCCGEEGCS